MKSVCYGEPAPERRDLRITLLDMDAGKGNRFRMVATYSTMLPLGTAAPGFNLKTPEGARVSLGEFQGKAGLVVAFICNHCPYVKHVRAELARLAKDYSAQRVGFVGISSNDPDHYPADSPERMAEEARAAGYIFPYLFDETQEVAKSYRAACTPDFYLFDREQRLFYRGQLDDSRPGSGVVADGSDLRRALDVMLAGGTPPLNQKPSIGCNIKWRPGNEPDYF
jgi:peroxiredoxin